MFYRVASIALSAFYKLSRAGHDVPGNGPVLLVANHPNSLVDPALVIYAARRPVSFLAKATLFSVPGIGWLVRGSGAIPVYRRVDDPKLMDRNAEMFSAVNQALAAGRAVGLFPEGVSHSEPSLAPLKTGAARIALGAAQLIGSDFPIVPVGLVFRQKATFRSHAHAIIGRRVEWSDLAERGEGDSDAVRVLTRRIDEALRDVTINLETWEDAPIVELAEAIYAAEYDLRKDPVERVARMREITRVLATMRAQGNDQWVALAKDIERHGRLLNWIQMSPRSLKSAPHAGGAVWWTIRRVPLVLGALSGIWVLGTVLFWVPYKVTALIAREGKGRSPDIVSTAKLLGGTLAFKVWILLLAAVAWLAWGITWGLIAIVTLPLLGLFTLAVRESLASAIRDARRFFQLTRGSAAIDELRTRQVDLARRLSELWRGQGQQASS